METSAVEDALWRERAFRAVISIVGTVGLFVGVQMVETGPIGASVPAALAGAASQLSMTAVAAIAILFTSMANVAMGAAIARMILARPFDSLGSLVLTGLAVAVLVDTAALMLLGGLGIFVWPLIVGLHLAVFAVAWYRFRGLPTIQVPTLTGLDGVAYVLPVLVWGAAIVLQLASPVVPFMDVLFNHVAPVEHARVFGSFETLTTSPSPNFGPSRTLFGFVALQSTLAVAVQLPAALAIAAYALPLTIVFALATQRLTQALFGRGAGYWAMITVPLTFVFLRIPDARATALVFPLVAWALALLVAPMAGTTRRQRQLMVLTPLAAGLYVHPFIAGLVVLTIGLMTLLWPRRYARIGFPAIVGAFLLALPQAAATLGVAAPAWSGLLAIPIAGAGVLLTDRWVTALVRVGRVALVLGGIGVLLVAQEVARFASDAVRDMAFPFPLLAFAALVGAALFGRRGEGWRIVAAGLGVAVIVMVVARLLPPESPLVQSLQGEAQPKALAYWGPFLLALAAAAACHRLIAARREFGLGHVVVALYVYVAILPVRLAPSTVAIDNYEEHRMAESVSIALRHAQDGYWVNYPDARRIVNGSQQEVLDRLETERADGRIGPDTHLLHAAESFRPWVGTPVAVFTGIYESTASHDPERSIHTEGGRLHDLAEFATLVEGDYDYVLLEGEALVAGHRGAVMDAGFSSILVNERGELFARATSSMP
ncbi:MAG: hypothetical protein ACT4OQ_10560 [Chloroflexota bacterium]